jgi:hypothetical protein
MIGRTEEQNVRANQPIPAFFLLTSMQPHGPVNGVVAPCRLGAVGHSGWLPSAGSSSGTQRADLVHILSQV